MHAAYICDAVSCGQTLAQICRDLDISRLDVYRWINDDKDFAEQMEAARAAGYDALADEALAIADDDQFDMVDGKRNKEWVQRSKLKFEARMKLLSKWHPKRYGDKIEVTATNRTAVQQLSDDPQEAARQYEELMRATG